jgi:apolipoprotein N-acyltransferase
MLTALLVWAATPGLGDQPVFAVLALTPYFLCLRGLRPRAATAWGLVAGLCYAVPGKFPPFYHAVTSVHPSWRGDLELAVLFGAVAAPFALFGALWCALPRLQRGAIAPWIAGFGLASAILCCPQVFMYTPAVLISRWPLLTQLAEIGGEPLLLGLLLTLNAGLAQCWPGAGNRGAVLAVLVPAALALGYGVWRLPQVDSEPSERLTVLTLQAQWPSGTPDAMLTRDLGLSAPRSAIELTRAGVAANPDVALVLWPETPRVTRLPDRSCIAAQRLAAELDTPLLITCHLADDILTTRLVTPAGIQAERRKARRVPAIERPLLEASDPLAEAGSPIAAAELPPLLAAICYEIHFRHDLRRAVNAGAQVLLQQANLSLFRDWRGGELDLAMARIHAVELRRSLLRSVNGGSAGMVLPSGRWLAAGDAETSAFSAQRAPLRSDLTPYARFGDSLFWLVLASMAALSVLRARPGAPVSQVSNQGRSYSNCRSESVGDTHAKIANGSPWYGAVRQSARRMIYLPPPAADQGVVCRDSRPRLATTKGVR